MRDSNYNEVGKILNEGRLRRFVVSKDVMVSMLNGQLVLNNVPADAVVIFVHPAEAYYRAGVVLTIHSAQFEPVKVGDEIPLTMMEYTTIEKEK